MQLWRSENTSQLRKPVAGASPSPSHEVAVELVDPPDGKPVEWPPPSWTSNHITVLLLLSPLGALAHFGGWRGFVVFALNFIPLIPLACMAAQTAEQVALHVGDVLGGLLTATVGNAAELILSCVALRRNQVEIVQASLVGSMLSSLLFMTGVVIFLNGIRQREHTVDSFAVVANSGLMLVGTLALSLPTLYVSLAPETQNDLHMSHAAAATLAALYVQFIYFQTTAQAGPYGRKYDIPVQMSLLLGVATLLVVCLVMMVHSELLVRSLEPFAVATGLNKRFIGAVLLPLTGNAAEYSVAIAVTLKGRLALALGLLFASCTQIALFVVPVTVLVGWATGVRMDLSFHPFEVVVLHLSVLLVAELLRGGIATWFQGSLLLATYSLVACGFYYLPAASDLITAVNATRAE